MKFITRFDDSLLDRIESLCHKVQRQTGWTNFDLAKLIPVLILLLDLFRPVRYYYASVSNFSDMLVLYFVIFLAEKLNSFVRWRSKSTIVKNPARHALLVIRIPAYLFFGLQSIGAIFTFGRMPIMYLLGRSSLGGYTLVYLQSIAKVSLITYVSSVLGYLLILLVCVSPLPPSPGKFWEKLFSFLPGRFLSAPSN